MVDIMTMPPENRLVHTAQTILKARGYYNLALDGDYGEGTSDAVERFKQVNGLRDRDYIGPKTWAHMVSPEAKDWTEVVGPKGDVPPMVREAMKHLGLRERPGPANNPVIMGWASDLGINYSGDDIPWCGLFCAEVAQACYPDVPLTPNPLGARNWGGQDVTNGGNAPGWGLAGSTNSLPYGGIAVLWRKDKHSSWYGHVGIIDAQNATHFRLIGGNQSNSVSQVWFPRYRLLGTRVSPSMGPRSAPELKTGTLSTSEA